MSRTRAWYWLGGVLALVACETPVTTLEFPVAFLSKTADGDVLPGVKLTAHGQEMGVTDQSGILRLTVTGLEGDSIPFEIACPTGYSKAGTNKPLLLRKLNDSKGTAEAEVVVRCQADKRIAALLVSVPEFAGLPVRVHGQEVARTDAHGVAHVSLEGSENTPLRVVLDTGARPYIVPASPHKDIRIGARDEIFVFTPELSETFPEKPKAKPKRAPKVVEEPKEEVPEIVRPERL